ncbi:Helicase MOV-10, partial [Desmophyllum pertusum]
YLERFLAKHFTHVFIDEAGHSLQPECLVPLAGLFSTETPGGGQLVFAGDPQQLGPVLRSPVAIKCGLGMSLLEWMMTKVPFYGRILQDEEDELGDYNPLIITKLLKNYRSHPSILELPNKMFYDDELEAHADELKRESLCSEESGPCSLTRLTSQICGKVHSVLYVDSKGYRGCDFKTASEDEQDLASCLPEAAFIWILRKHYDGLWSLPLMTV